MTVGGREGAIPGWLEPVRAAADAITVDELTRFAPPEDADARPGAVLMLFDGATRADGHLLLTERAHHMRSHPGQVSFPGGAVDPGESPVEAALRETWEETGVDPAGVEVFARLPDLWLPPSNFAVTPVIGWWRAPALARVVDPDEVHAVHAVSIDELVDPAHRVTVEIRGYQSPAFLIGPDHDVLCWGFTAGIIARLFDFIGWSVDWDATRFHPLPPYMLQGRERAGRLPPPPPPAPVAEPTPHPRTDGPEAS